MLQNLVELLKTRNPAYLFLLNSKTKQINDTINNVDREMDVLKLKQKCACMDKL